MKKILFIIIAVLAISCSDREDCGRGVAFAGEDAPIYIPTIVWGADSAFVIDRLPQKEEGDKDVNVLWTYPNNISKLVASYTKLSEETPYLSLSFEFDKDKRLCRSGVTDYRIDDDSAKVVINYLIDKIGNFKMEPGLYLPNPYVPTWRARNVVIQRPSSERNISFSFIDPNIY